MQVSVKDREGGGEREREREKENESERYREIGRERERQREREIDREIEREREREREAHNLFIDEHLHGLPIVGDRFVRPVHMRLLPFRVSFNQSKPFSVVISNHIDTGAPCASVPGFGVGIFVSARYPCSDDIFRYGA